MSKLVVSAACGLALIGFAMRLVRADAAALEGGARAAEPASVVVPYLSGGAGVWIDRRTGRPLAGRAGGPAAPPTAGVHYARP